MKREAYGYGNLSEADFLAQVRQLAAWLGWRAYHTHDSRRSPAGFPDLVLARKPRLIFAEIKAAQGALTPEQKLWLDELGGAPCVEAYVWRPADFENIRRILAREMDGRRR